MNGSTARATRWGVHGDALGHGARLVAAADYYRTKTEPRPHRDALAPRDAAKSARDEVRLGHLDGDAVEAVLVASGHASGHRVRRRRRAVAELTSREAEVLGLVAQGLSNKQVAVRLGISPKTVGNHVEHIYTKLEVNNRTLASVRATHDGLVDPGRQVRT
ncbi:MAG: LuxR C-terminal-related transcriptional regulator [Microthrixaceae bacterium]|nr:LuxR C-terminal-related transcriptional regulator [Microthrixaceae bacterium]